MPKTVFGSGGIQVAVGAFFAGETFQVTLDAPMTDDSVKVSVSGEGANSPLSDLKLEADFADGDDGVSLSLSAEVVSAWAFSNAFPDLKGTYFDQLDVASGSLSLDTTGSGASVSLKGELSVAIGAKPVGTAFFEARHDTDGTGFLVGVVLPESLSPGAVWPNLNELFGKLTFSDSGFVVSTIDAKLSDFPDVTVPSLPDDLKAGVTVFTSLKLTGKGFGLLSQLFSNSITLNLSAFGSADASEFDVKATLPGAAGKGILVFDGLTIELIAGTDVPPQFSIDASATLTLKDESVTVEGGGTIVLEPTPSVTLDLNVESWNEPFGIKGLDIQDIGVGVSVEDDGFEVGLIGTVEIGTTAPFILSMAMEANDLDGFSALSFELKDPDPNHPLELTDLIKEFTSLDLSNVPLLNGLAFKDFDFYVVIDPSGSWTDPKGNVFPDGIGLRADVSFQSWELNLKVLVDDMKGIIASGAISKPIVFKDVLTLSDATGENGPSASVDTSQFAKPLGQTARPLRDASPYFSMSGGIACMGLNETFAGSVSNDGFDVAFSCQLESLFQASFTGSCSKGRSFSCSANGTFDFEFDAPELKVNGVPVIPAVHVSGPSGSLDIAVAVSTSSASVALKLQFTWGDFNFDVHFSLDAQQVANALSDLWNHMVAWIEANLKEFYKVVLADAKKFVAAIKHGVLKLGQKAEYVARALVAAFDSEVKEVADFLVEIGYETREIVDALVAVFHIAESEAVGYVSSCALGAARYFIYGS